MNKKFFVLFALLPYLLLAEFGVDFNQSMAITEDYNLEEAQSKITYRIAKHLYDIYLRTLYLHVTPCIPKIDHHIWLGSPLPESQHQLYKTWLDHHTDWVHVFWVDRPENYHLGDVVVTSLDALQECLDSGEYVGKTIVINKRKFDFDCQEAYRNAWNYGERSDVMRYEILFKFGGLYVDTDFECLQPFDQLNHSCDFYVGLNHHTKIFEVHNSLIGSAPGHPIMQECVDQIKRGVQGTNTLTRTGPHFLTKCLLHTLKTKKDASGRVVLFPPTYFHPWPSKYNQQNKRSEIESWLRPESFGVHHWHMSWMMI